MQISPRRCECWYSEFLSDYSIDIILRGIISMITASLNMPPKSRKQQLSAEKASAAREGKKKARIDEPVLEELPIVSAEHEVTATSTSVAHAEDPTETDCSNVTYDLEQDASAQSVLMQFIEDWVSTLDRENTISLAPFLTYNLTSLLIFFLY